MTTIRALRVGVLLQGNLVEERLFLDADRLPITVGQSLRCRLSIPADGLPMEHTLFAFDEGRFLLRPPAKLTGRLAQGGKTIELREGMAIALERGARGKIQVGDATILFQEVAAPPVQPRPMLPASIRGSLLDRVDRRLAVVIGASLAAHIAIGSWAWLTADPERPSSLVEDAQAQATRDVYSIVDETPLPEPTPVKTDAEPTPGVAKPAVPAVQTPRHVVPNPTVNPDRPPTRPEHLTTEAEAKRLAELLTTNDETRNGAGDMGRRRPQVDLDRMAKDAIEKGQTPVLGNNERISRTDGDPQAARRKKGTVVDAPQSIERLDKKPAEVETERLPPVVVVKRPPGGEDVLAKIQGAYMGSIQRCYLRGLKGEATLSGTVSLTLTVDERGRVANPSASGVSPGVADCVQGLMNNWIFQIKKDKEGDPIVATYTISLAMTPN